MQFPFLKKVNKAFVLIIFCTPICNELHAQKEPELYTTKDGTEFTYQMLKKDPNVKFNWQLTGGGAFMISEKHLNIGLAVNGKYQITPVFEFRGDANVAQPINVTLPDEINDFSDPIKLSPYQNHSGELGYTFYRNIKNKKTHIILKEKYDGKGSTVYYLEKRLDYRESLSFIAGVNSTVRRIGTEDLGALQVLSGLDTIDGKQASYWPVRFNTTNLKLGFEWRLSTAGKMKINGKISPNHQDARIYAMLLIPVKNVIDVTRSLSPMQVGGLYEYELVTEGYVEPELRPFGFLVGVEAFNARSSNTLLAYKVEIGVFPGFKDDGIFKSFYGGMGITYGIGSDLFKQLDKVKKN